MENVKTLMPIKEFVGQLNDNHCFATNPELMTELLPGHSLHEANNKMVPPFYQPPAHPVMIAGTTAWSALDVVRNFTDEHFSRLTHLSANLLACLHEQSSTEPFYIIGSGFKSRLLHKPHPDSWWYILVDKQFNGKYYEAIIWVLDESGRTDMLLQFDYSLLTQDKMLSRFPSIFREMPAPQSFNPVMPAIVITESATYGFSATLSPFSAAHCQGHFPQFTFVPVVFLQTSIIRQIYQWMKNTLDIHPAGLLPTNVEVCAWRIIETDRSLYFQHQVMITGRNSYKILTHVYDSPVRLSANMIMITDLSI